MYHNCFLILPFQRDVFLRRYNFSKIIKRIINNKNLYKSNKPPLWYSGQSFWLQVKRSRVRFPALPDVLRSSGSGTGSTQPREVN